MSDTLLRIAVTGITGRMGKEIVKYISAVRVSGQFNNTIVLGAAIARSHADICGMDIGTLMKNNALGVIIADNLESVKDDFDILIDFTAPNVSIEYLKFCVDNHKNMVIGTTGFDKTHKELIKSASKKIGIVFSPNFSIGIALISRLLRKITKIIGNNADIALIETHHNKKRDIPSGTSLMIKEVIVNTLQANRSDSPMDYNITSTKKCISPTYSHDSLPSIYSIRAGDIIGEHTVLFAISGERIEITHKASDRIIFARGALCSAIWLGRNKIGLFDVSDALEINTLS